MPCLKRKLIPLCAILSLSSLAMCTTTAQVDSFCQLYGPVIVGRGDGDIKANLAVKKRILANEQFYRQACKKTKT